MSAMSDKFIQDVIRDIAELPDRTEHERTLPLEGFADCTIGGPAIEHAMEYRRQLYVDMGLVFV